MDYILTVLQSSSDNDERKKAAQQLRDIKEKTPEAFLEYTWNVIRSSTAPGEARFFACTAVLEFVRDTWHNAVPKEAQEAYVRRYLDLTLSESFTSVPLTRKVASVVALMTKRGLAKSQVGEKLPRMVHEVAGAYVGAIMTKWTTTAAAPQAGPPLPQLLLCLHLFLKEMRSKWIGKVFDNLCEMMVEPLSSMFAYASAQCADPVQNYEVILYLLKCALRVFGQGLFVANFYPFLLEIAWKDAAGLGSAPSYERVRLLEYCVKIMEQCVVHFPAELNHLPPTFFIHVEATGESGDQSLFHLLCAIIEAGKSHELFDKAACRSLRLLTSLFAIEEGDDCLKSCLAALGQSPLLVRVLRALILNYFPDECTADQLGEWANSPEKIVAELDVDMDDEDSAVSCAEQLFLALTQSGSCASASLAQAWAIINEQLASGDVTNITAALHAVGLGYYTMTDAQGGASYLQFLQHHLLPILRASVAAEASQRPSLFVLRRVVWLIGMWCESVPELDQRRQVHMALEEMLQHQDSTVIVLTALRSTENFISDNHFALEELPPTAVTTILQTVQRALPYVHEPSTVKELAGIIYVLIEKGALVSDGDFIVQIFLPAAVSFITSYEQKAQHSGEAGDDGDEDCDPNISTLGMLVDCLKSGVSICVSEDTVWSLFKTVVVPCTEVGKSLTPWAEDYGWELLLAMCRSTRTFNPLAQEALLWCSGNMDRDFAVLYLVLRCTYTLLLLRSQVDDFITGELVAKYLNAVVENASCELSASYFALCLTCARFSSVLRPTIASSCMSGLASSTEVQGDNYTMLFAVLLFACLQFSDDGGALARQVISSVSSHLAEQIVLLLDVSPSCCVSNMLVRLLQGIREAPALTTDDQRMIDRAAESGTQAFSEDEVRPFDESMLELLGDEAVTAQSPHFVRLVANFAALNVA